MVRVGELWVTAKNQSKRQNEYGNFSPYSEGEAELKDDLLHVLAKEMQSVPEEKAGNPQLSKVLHLAWALQLP